MASRPSGSRRPPRECRWRPLDLRQAGGDRGIADELVKNQAKADRRQLGLVADQEQPAAGAEPFDQAFERREIDLEASSTTTSVLSAIRLRPPSFSLLLFVLRRVFIDESGFEVVALGELSQGPGQGFCQPAGRTGQPQRRLAGEGAQEHVPAEAGPQVADQLAGERLAGARTADQARQRAGHDLDRSGVLGLENPSRAPPARQGSRTSDWAASRSDAAPKPSMTKGVRGGARVFLVFETDTLDRSRVAALVRALRRRHAFARVGPSKNP